MSLENLIFALPVRKRGRKTATEQAEYTTALDQFYKAILKIKSRLDFEVSARGWCYLMEQQGLITKAEFDRVETLINDARKTGVLPLNICAVDETRSFDGLEYLDTRNPDDYIQNLKLYVEHWVDNYTPVSFWDDKPVYLEMLVEKIDLKSLFGPICRESRIPIANAKGWPDIHVRAAMMRRFKKHEESGRKCVLLYCGDHDPAGLLIAQSYRAMFADIQAVGWQPDKLVIERFGINADFIQEHRLSWIENLITGHKDKKDLTDPKHPDHLKPYVQSYLKQFGTRKCEANALVTVPEAARELCRNAIERYLPDTIQDARDYYQSRLELPRMEVKRRFSELLASGWELHP